MVDYIALFALLIAHPSERPEMDVAFHKVQYCREMQSDQADI